MPRPSPARFAIPSVLSVSILTLAGCSSPVMPGSCVMHFVPPDGATAPPAGIAPQVDITPCAMQRSAVDWACVTTAGCQVVYIGDVNSMQGAPVATVSCATTDQCLWGIDASGRPVFGACPQLEVQPQQCTNVFHFDDPTRSSFECHADVLGCTLAGGGQGHRFASVTRAVSGSADSTACPTTCSEFS